MPTSALAARFCDLLALIQGTVWPFSLGLTSYDCPDDPALQGLHQACLELERRGQLRRAFVAGDAVG